MTAPSTWHGLHSHVDFSSRLQSPPVSLHMSLVVFAVIAPSAALPQQYLRLVARIRSIVYCALLAV